MAPTLYEFSYTEDALEFLKSVTKKHRRQIVRKIQNLANEPHPAGSKLVRGMIEGEDRVYRIRSGDFRVLYVVRNAPKKIIVIDIGNRRDIYR